jgi:glutamine synthetase
MKNNDELIKMNASPLVNFAGKLPQDFQRKDIVAFVEANSIQNIQFRYPARDGKLKVLKFAINSRAYLDRILAEGERVDGSSLFPGIVDSSSSDLYVVPVYKYAFVNPFYDKTLDIVCRFFDKNGNPVKETSDNVLAKAHDVLKTKTGFSMNALGELEFYLIFPDTNELFPGKAQGTYHEAGPYVKGEKILCDILRAIAQITGRVKYCHSEVGYISNLASENPALNSKHLEQHEIEFLPAPLEDMAVYVLIAKWIIRNYAERNNISATFAPKLDEGDAGNGMHFHLELMKHGRNMMADETGSLSETALRLIAGLMKLSPSLTAFGNTVSSSYLRLTPHQEAPVMICWSELNRSALVRVPLGWRGIKNLAVRANPAQADDFTENESVQTVEFRAPDGTADVHLLLAGFAVAARLGLTMPDALELTKRTHVTGNVFEIPEVCRNLDMLPRSCHESAKELIKQSQFFIEHDVFNQKVLDFAVERLMLENDQNLFEQISKMSNKEKLIEQRRIMHRVIHRL